MYRVKRHPLTWRAMLAGPYRVGQLELVVDHLDQHLLGVVQPVNSDSS